MQGIWNKSEKPRKIDDVVFDVFVSALAAVAEPKEKRKRSKKCRVASNNSWNLTKQPTKKLFGVSAGEKRYVIAHRWRSFLSHFELTPSQRNCKQRDEVMIKNWSSIFKVFFIIIISSDTQKKTLNSLSEMTSFLLLGRGQRWPFPVCWLQIVMIHSAKVVTGSNLTGAWAD